MKATKQQNPNKVVETRPFHEVISALIDACPKRQNQIAEEMGMIKANNITMFKTGLTRVPIRRLPALAKSIGADATYLVRLWFQQYDPEALEVIETFHSFPVTDNEKNILKTLREKTHDLDPKMFKPQQREALGYFASTLLD